MLDNRKILITGAMGQLGQEMEEELKKRGVECLALDRDKLDITDFSAVKKTTSDFKPDFLINCAAYNDVDKAEEDWQNAFMINGIGVRNLALAARENSSVFVHFSTVYVFDGKTGTPYKISDAPNPINKYGESKLFGEKITQDFSDNYYLIRLSSVFGKNPAVSFPLKMIGWAKKDEKLRIVDDQVFSLCFARDVAKATLDLIETGQYGLYHMANKGSCSKYEWAKYILSYLKWDIEVLPAKTEDFDNPAQRPMFSVLDNFPLKRIIGYELPTWQEATDRFLDEIKEEI